MAGTTRTTTPNRYVWLTWGVAPRCTAILHGRRRIQRYRSLTRLTDVALLSDPINSPRWPPESYLATTGDTNTTTATTLTRDRRTTNTNSKPNLPPVLEPSNQTHPAVPKVHHRTNAGLSFLPRPCPLFRCTGPDGNPPEPTQAKIPPPSTLPPAPQPNGTSPGCHRSKVPTRPPIGRISRCIAEAGPLPIRSAEDRLPREASTTRTHAAHPHHTNTLPMGIHSRRSREQHGEAVWSSLRSFALSPRMGGRSGQQQTHTPSSAFHHPALRFSAGAGSPLPYLFNPVFWSHTR